MSKSSGSTPPDEPDAAVLPVDELVVLYHRAVAIAATVADLAEREAERAESRGDPAGARTARARAIRTRRAAANGRSAARRLHVRHQAAQLLEVPRDWGTYLAAGTGSPPKASVPPEVAVAVIGTDLAGIVRVWNAAAERLYGWERREVLGRAIAELTVGPEDAEVVEGIMRHVRQTGSWEGEFWVRRHDRTRFLAYVRDALVRDLERRPVGVVGVSIDLDPGVLVQLSDEVGRFETDVVPLRRRPPR